MKELKERNKQIGKDYKPGLGGVLGKAQDPPVSRQRIHQIKNKIISQKHQNRAWRWLKGYVGLYWRRKWKR